MADIKDVLETWIELHTPKDLRVCPPMMNELQIMMKAAARIKELESPWTVMRKNDVIQVYPDSPGWYEVMFEDRELQVMEWPMDDPYEWMLAQYFRKWIPPHDC